MNSGLSSYIDHSLLKPTASKEEIVKLCKEAAAYSFKAVCIPPYYVSLASDLLKGKKVNVCTVIGFPLGYCHKEAKLLQAKLAVSDGADELDMVINQCALKNGGYDYVLEEIKSIKETFPDKTVKVIVETCNLTLNEKERIVKVVMDSGADFIKTSTGFAASGADINDIILFKKTGGDRLKIKASGGIKDAESAKAFIKAGASRIGTSSGVSIVNGA
jgi:deoxyribose-phosphate aldolase